MHIDMTEGVPNPNATVQAVKTRAVVRPSPLAPGELEGVWNNSIQQFQAASELLQQRKADAERDRELFRDLYNRASSHASQVSKENEDLLERLTVAEGQAKDGVAMVRKTYEDRLAKLEGELAQLKGMNAVLAARDMRTNGDDIRRKAAEEEELRAENQKLRAELAELRMNYNRMEGLLEQLGEEELGQLGEQEEELRDKAGVEILRTTDDRQTRTPTGPLVTVEHIG